MQRTRFVIVAALAACGGGGGGGGGGGDGGSNQMGTSPVIGGCPVFPANHIFNTPIDGLPADPNSDAYISLIGTTRRIHLDLGTEIDQTQSDYYGIPYNVVKGGSISPWLQVDYFSSNPGYSWDPRAESDCAGSDHKEISPCTTAAAPAPQFPIPSTVLVEGGINSSSDEMPDGDHHMLLVDSDKCTLYELYHSYGNASGSFDIFGSAMWDMASNNLRPDTWTSADAAGFPIMPLLLKADEASSGTITHAFRFTIDSSSIRQSYVWPARHLTTNGTMSTSQPPMGQLFRLKASYQIPATYGTQSQAILQALKTYGMYIADGGSNMFIQGEPSASWADATFSEVQSVDASNFEAVDITAITSRSGFDPNSGAVP